MMKKIFFFILFATMFIFSGCSLMGLTDKDKLDIADGIGQVHAEGNIPDTWKSENGIDISVLHQGFGQRADGTYCMTASVIVGNDQYMPPTLMCNENGEWKKVAKLEQSSVLRKTEVSAPKAAKTQQPTAFIPKVAEAEVKIKPAIIPVRKTEVLPEVKPAVAQVSYGEAKQEKVAVDPVKEETPAVVKRAEAVRAVETSEKRSKPHTVSIVSKVRKPIYHPRRKSAVFVKIR